MAILISDPLDLLVDSSNELVFENGDLKFSSGGDGVAQLIRHAVGLVRGEWFLDLDAGVPYFERDGVEARDAILGQVFDQAKTESTFRAAIADVAGVGSVDSVTATYANSSRLLTITWQVTTTFGDTVSDTLTREA